MERRTSLLIFILICIVFLVKFVFPDDEEFEEAVYRIIGGIETKYDEFPFMASLGWFNNVTGKTDFLGGGMLIAPNFVLTAAHCVFLKGKLPSVVAIGGNNLKSTYNEEHIVKNFFIFPEYTNNQAYYDIALLELEKNSGRRPVCLWTASTLYTKNVTAIGYGVKQFAAYRSAELLKVNLIVYPPKVCKQFFKRQRKFRSGIRNSHMCAGDPEGLRDTCQGDSGGPLMVEFNRQIYAAGITSTGQACSGFPPAVYTKISSYIGWIKEIVQEHGYSIRKTCGVS